MGAATALVKASLIAGPRIQILNGHLLLRVHMTGLIRSFNHSLVENGIENPSRFLPDFYHLLPPLKNGFTHVLPLTLAYQETARVDFLCSTWAR
jgi:hypothetical protein